jgi:hypothetical protein
VYPWVRRHSTVAWMVAAFIIALMIVAMIRMGARPGERLPIALRTTARWSFLLFWAASVGRALATLFGSRFEPLAKRARDFGLSFASAHIVHLSLVVWLYAHYMRPQELPPIFLLIGVFWTYLLALASIRQISSALPTRVWKIARAVGVEYISLVFLLDFAKNPFQYGVVHLVEYLPFQMLAIAGPILRLAAAIKRRADQTRLPATS